MPALPVPLQDDFTPDLPTFARLVSRLAAVPGVTGFLVNGHAGENGTLTLNDQVAVARTAVEAAHGRLPIVSGVNVAATEPATAFARQLVSTGVDALMVFPPDGWALGVTREAVLHHHRAIIEACDCDVLLFQASVNAGALAYGPDTLKALVSLPQVRAVKEGSWEVAAYEANRRLVRAVAPHVSVMGSGDEHLFTSAVVGSEGAIVSLAAVIPEAIVRLHEAVERGDLAAARAEHEVIYPIARAVYGAPPANRATQRLKTLLMLQEAFASDRMVPPATATVSAERATLEALSSRAAA